MKSWRCRERGMMRECRTTSGWEKVGEAASGLGVVAGGDIRRPRARIGPRQNEEGGSSSLDACRDCRRGGQLPRQILLPRRFAYGQSRSARVGRAGSHQPIREITGTRAVPRTCISGAPPVRVSTRSGSTQPLEKRKKRQTGIGTSRQRSPLLFHFYQPSPESMCEFWDGSHWRPFFSKMLKAHGIETKSTFSSQSPSLVASTCLMASCLPSSAPSASSEPPSSDLFFFTMPQCKESAPLVRQGHWKSFDPGSEKFSQCTLTTCRQ